MSAANMKFYRYGDTQTEAKPGEEQVVMFDCPKGNGRCGPLILKGRTKLKHDPNNKNGGVAQWGWDGNREKPTLTPSVNCRGCWHGYIRAGRCVDTRGKDE